MECPRRRSAISTPSPGGERSAGFDASTTVATRRAPPSAPAWVATDGGRGDAVQPGQGHGRTASATRGRALWSGPSYAQFRPSTRRAPWSEIRATSVSYSRAAISLPIIRSTASRHQPDRWATPGSPRSSRKRIWVTFRGVTIDQAAQGYDRSGQLKRSHHAACISSVPTSHTQQRAGGQGSSA